MRLPPTPGVYVVELLNDNPISVNADRLAIADQCIMVNRMNCKFGQAVNLARRQRNYERTFGVQNVRFTYFFETRHYSDIERLAKAHLTQYRMIGRSGRRTEWIQGITANQVVELIQRLVQSIPTAVDSLKMHGIRQHSSHPVENMAQRPGITPSQIVDAATYLASTGMPLGLLRQLHHSPRQTETFRATISYFSKKSEVRDNNIVYGARLAHVANEHKNTGREFEILVKEAIQRYRTDA
jgi:hypothetical protein